MSEPMDPLPPDKRCLEKFLGEDWVNQVLTTREADLRGHMVCLTYSKLAVVLDDLLHPDVPDGERRRETNWFNYATWGTVTVTRNIGLQRPPLIDTALPFALRRRLTPLLLQERAASGQRISRALAWGQRLIYVTAAFAMKQFTETDPSDAKFELSDTTENKILERTERGGVQWVEKKRHLCPIGHAFDLYWQATKTTNVGVRARLILGANIILTAVEQDLADPAVETVIGHVPKRALDRVDRRVARLAESWTGTPRQIVELQLPFRTAPARSIVDAVWSRLMTDQVLVMALPTETLRLGRDIPPRRPADPFYPWPVRDLEWMPVDPATPPQFGQPRTPIEKKGTKDEEEATRRLLRKVANLVRSFDRTRGGGRGSAAQDWRRFDDRMNWAVTLIRSRHDDDTLYWPPYAIEDEHRIVEGRLPHKAGDPSQYEVQAPLFNSASLRRAKL